MSEKHTHIEKYLLDCYFNTLPKKIDFNYMIKVPDNGKKTLIYFDFELEKNIERPKHYSYSSICINKESAMIEMRPCKILTEDYLSKLFSLFKVKNVKENIQKNIERQNKLPDDSKYFVTVRFEIEHSENTYKELNRFCFKKNINKYLLSKEKIELSDNVIDKIYQCFEDSFFKSSLRPKDFYDSLTIKDFKIDNNDTNEIYKINENEYLEHLELNYGR
tara:strand:+ start:3034 stop:3690 length:657 start_codon:yes stop_codon:yes gene_type:complete